MLGTRNRYGSVELYAGRYNDSYHDSGLDYVETFETPHILDTFKAALRDWTNAGFDPFAAPAETGTTVFGKKNGDNIAAIERSRETCRRMPGLPNDTSLRSDENGYAINRAFADVDQDEPEVQAEPGFENEVHAMNLFKYLSRSDVTWNPSVVSVCRNSLFCPTTEEHMLPIIHGNDRVEWFIQLSDQITLAGGRQGNRPTAGQSHYETQAMWLPCRPISGTRAFRPSAPCCWCGKTRHPACPSDMTTANSHRILSKYN